MKRLPVLCLLFILLSLAASGMWAQSEPLVIETAFTGPRAEFSPDGRLLAVFEDAAYASAMEVAPSEANTVILLFDADTGEKASVLEGARDFTGSILFSADGARLYSLHSNGDLLTWDTATGALLNTARTPIIGTRTPLFWHPVTGELVAAIQAFSYTTYTAVEPETGALTLLTMHPGFDTYGEFYAAQTDRGPRVMNDIVAVPFPQLDAPLDAPLAGDEVWTVNPQGQIALLPLSTGEAQVLAEGDDVPMFGIRDLVATVGGLVAYADSSKDTLYVIDLVNQTTAEFPIEHQSALLSPDGLRFAQYNEDGTALLFTTLADSTVETADLPAGLTGIRTLQRLRFSPDGSRLAAAGLMNEAEQGVVLLYRMEG